MTPRRILLGGWLVFLVYAYPGYMRTDAANELVDSRYGTFTDWQSPMMTEVWRVIGRVISEPPGMLFLQSILVLAGSYLLLRRAMAERAAAIAAVCVLLFPPLIATSAVICPEAQLAGFLVVAMAALSSPRLRLRLVGLGLMVVACGMRDGGAVAALPIIVATFRWNDRQPRWQRLALAAAAWAVVALAASSADRLFVDTRSERNEVSLAMSDIVGTLNYAKHMDDAKLQRLLDGVPLASSTDIQRRAHSVYGKSPLYSTTDDRVFDPPVDEDQREALFAARRAVARAAPVGYLEHRWHQFARVLGFTKSGFQSPVYTDFVASPVVRERIRHAATHSLLQTCAIRPVLWLSRTCLFEPSLYLILAIVLLPLAVKRSQRYAAILLASGVLYELALMFVANRSEYRDSHWLIVATVLAIIMLVVGPSCASPGSRPRS